MSWSIPLRVAGSIVLCIGLAHLAMPTWGYDPAVAEAFTAQSRAHFYDLGTYAIGSFLIALGTLSLAFSRRPSPEAATYCVAMTVLWSTRFGLELLFPVDLSLFFVARPHPVLAVVIGLLAVLYGVAAVGLRSAVLRADTQQEAQGAC